MEDTPVRSSANFSFCPACLYRDVFMSPCEIPAGSSVESRTVCGVLSGKYSEEMGEAGA